MATPVADVPSRTSPCPQPSDEHTAEPGLNSSNTASSVADVPSRISPWPLPSDTQSNSTIKDIAVPSLNSSNSVPSAAEVPLVSPLPPKVARNEEFRSPIAADADGHLSCHTVNQSGLCLNSSNSISPLSSKSPESLCTLVRLYMVSTMFLDICEIDKYVLTHEKPAAEMPSSLKTIVTNYICERQPSIDLDDALTGILKTNILRKYEIRTQETALELDLNTLLKNLALKQKPKVIVPKMDKITLQRLTKVVPHWSELDPYSDLEEHCESGNASPCEPVSPDCVYFTKIGGHVLRKRHRSYSYTQTRRTSTGYTFYRDMCSSPKENIKPKKKKIVPKKEPSSACLKSQSQIRNKTEQVNLNLVQSYPMYHGKRNNVDQKSDHESESELVSDSDTIPYVPELDTTPKSTV